MSTQSLEDERKSILERMRTRRENYRRMLTDGADLDDVVIEQPAIGTHHAATMHRPDGTTSSLPAGQLHAYSGNTHVYTHNRVPDQFPRSTTMKVITEHPLLVAAAVAAVIAIGPRRIMRTAMTSGATLTALTMNNPSNADLAGRLLTMLGTYVQGRTANTNDTNR